MRCDLYTIEVFAPARPRPRCYHILMKLFSFLALLAAGAMAAVNPQIQKVNRVYILAMRGGMDQFLATQFTKLGVFEVVTDPQKADAIVTDHVGEPFENKLKDLYPAPAPAVEPKKDPDETKPADKASKDRLANLDFGGINRVSSFGSGKGSFFIVDRGTRTVLWSVFERPKDSTPGELSKTAEKVVKRLKSDMTEKKPVE
jgi:hypothetical protein